MTTAIVSPKRRRVVNFSEHEIPNEKGTQEPLLLEEQVATDVLSSISASSHDNCPTTLLEIPDGPFLHMLSFLSGGESLDIIRNGLEILAPACIAMNQKLTSLAHSTPVHVNKTFINSSKGISYFKMINRHQMKLQSLCMQFDDQVYKSIFYHTLETCNLDSMKELSVHIHPTKCDVDLLDLSDQVGVPCNKIHRAILLSNMTFQKHMADLLSEKQHEISKFHMRFKVEEKLHNALISNVAQHLKELELEAWCSLPGQDPYSTAKSLICLEKELHHLSKLKSISFSWPRIRSDMLLEFESASLENLSLSGGLKIQILKCPNLKRLNLVMYNNNIDFRIIQQCKASLEELTLKITHCSRDLSVYEKLVSIVNSAPKLRKFRLITRNQGVLTITSSSLEELDMTAAKNIVFKVQCPNLVSLKK